MHQKRGQQSSFGMSFGMIFSIFLIITFIAIAFVAINAFLDFNKNAKIGQFYSNLESEIKSVWRGSYTNKSFEINLPSGIKRVCFANLSKKITGPDDVYKEIIRYEYSGYNTFLLPIGAAGELDVKTLDHINLDKITSQSNPYCVKNPGELKIIKGIYSRKVELS